MDKKMEQSLWVTSISPKNIDGESYVPSAISYHEDGSKIIGRPAIQAEAVTQNFKVDLGDVRVGGSVTNRKKFKTSVGEKTAYELTKDYFDEFLKHLEREYPRSAATGHKHPAKIIVAEPLAFLVDDHSKQWVENYRANIRRILDRYEKVEFLPEPFAVYQYYRYGLRLPALQDKSKQIALILDFGGGTFDACIIESTKGGDVSLAGKNSKPLSADSIPVGGFFVNRQISKYLIKRNLSDPQKKEADKYYSQYERILKGDLDLEVLKPEAQSFIKNLVILEKNCEENKVALVSQLSDSDWRLDSDVYQKELVSIPKVPFHENTDWVETELFAHNLRDIFIREIWDNCLKRTIGSVISRARASLKGKSITLTLVSGGSSNFRWMQELLMRDFPDDLYCAEPVPISHSFQEVVANGLAIECARRFYDPDSEFVAVTYNPIKLYLDPDDSGIDKSKNYRSVDDKIDMSSASPGDLVPSAQALKHFFDTDLSWKIKLSKPPRHHLDYFFVRPDSNGDELDSYNVEETRLATRDSKHFDKKLTVNLLIRSDGTVTPKFTYKAANKEFDVEENSQEGRQFYIDMTADSVGGAPSQNFVGFDFGTSNSSACMLTQNEVRLTDQRQKDEGWKGLSASLSSLPYPIAMPLRNYLSSKSSGDLAEPAREVFEAALAFMAYVAASEASSIGLPVSLQSFQHRSMGPLKDLLERSLKAIGKGSVFSSGFSELFSKDESLLAEAINNFTDHKHHKFHADGESWHTYVEWIVKIVGKSMDGLSFGYCSTAVAYGFEGENKGLFVVANDQPRFVDNFRYVSTKNISPVVAILHKNNTSKAISLTPFIFWNTKVASNIDHNCFWLDKKDKKDRIIVTPCNEHDSDNVSEIDPHIDDASVELFKTGSTVFGAITLSEVKD